MRTQNNKPELILELNLQERRSQLYRLFAEDGTVMFYVESDLNYPGMDLQTEDSLPLFYSLSSALKCIFGFIGNNSNSTRTVWHQTTQDWLLLNPTFIHAIVRPLIMRALSEATRYMETLNPYQIDGLRQWIRRTCSSSELRINYPLITNTNYHVHAKRA